MKISKVSQGLLCVFMLIGGLGIRASQEIESTQEFIKSLPEEWWTAQGLLFVANSLSNNVSVLVVSEDGTLAQWWGSLRDTEGDRPNSMALSKDGRHLFIGNSLSNNISVFLVGDNSWLHLVDQEEILRVWPSFMELSKDGRYLFITGRTSGNVSVFEVGENGQLRSIGQPVDTGGREPVFMVLSEDGRYLFVANGDSNDVSVLAVGGNGQLRLMGQPIDTGGRWPISMALSKDGRYLFVVHFLSNDVSVLTVGDNGQLDLLGQPVSTGGREPNSLALSKDGRYLFVANGYSNNVSVLTVGDDGQLDLLGQPVGTGGREPISIALSENGQYLFVVHGSSSDVSVLAVGDNGQLHLVGSPAATGGRRAGEVLFAPLPQRWRDMKMGGAVISLPRSKTGEDLPEEIKEHILQMVLGRDVTFGEGKLPRDVQSMTYFLDLRKKREALKERIRKHGAQDLSIEDLTTYLYWQYYDKNRVAGGLLQQLASPFIEVQRGTLTPAGFQLLHTWAKKKNSKELEEAVQIMQELLREPGIATNRAKAFEVIKNHLGVLHKVRSEEEREE